MKKFFPLFLALLFIIVSVEPLFGFGKKVLRVTDGKVISFGEMINEVRKSNIIFVGEVHNMSEHHDAQLAIIQALHESDMPIAVGLEMFRVDSQRSLDSWVRGTLSEKQFLPVYYDNWTEPWPLYGKIFEYAREHEIPLVGLNIPDAIARKIAKEGFASLSDAEKKQLPPGITCTVDPTYMEFIKRAYAGHRTHDKGFINFCEAQMVWDKSMAWHITGYLKQNQNKIVVVLAGIGHAWKRGIAEQLERGPNPAYRVVLPAIPEEINRESVTTRDADYLLLE